MDVSREGAKAQRPLRLRVTLSVVTIVFFAGAVLERWFNIDLAGILCGWAVAFYYEFRGVPLALRAFAASREENQ